MAIDVAGLWAFMAICFFMLWFVLSIIVQFAGVNRKLDRVLDPVRSADRFSLLPAWTFFAPRPGQTDIHLLYRDFFSPDRASPWHEAMAEGSLRPCDPVWSPSKRSRKVLVDLTQGLMEKASGDTIGRFRLAGEYICILNYVVHLDSTPFSSHRQFALAESKGALRRTELSAMFVSDVHPLPDYVRPVGPLPRDVD